jgi:prephenate dehydrogenase
MRSKNITIIGGSGGMGQVFSKYFKNHGFLVTIFARDEKRLKIVAENLGVVFATSIEESVKKAELVLISVPIMSTIDVIKSITPHVKEDALICDITSLKTEICQVYKQEVKKYPINCISLHPMFGPGITSMKSYMMLLIRIDGTKNYDILVNELIELFKSDGLNVVETNPDIHDAKIALTLGLPHMINILFLNLLRKSNEQLKELTRFTGTTFLLQKVFAESIIQREMDMFSDIQMENPKFLEVIDQLRSLIDEYKTIIETKDRKKFFELFNESLGYSKNDVHFEQSYGYFYEFMKILKKKEKQK